MGHRAFILCFRTSVFYLVPKHSLLVLIMCAEKAWWVCYSGKALFPNGILQEKSMNNEVKSRVPP